MEHRVAEPKAAFRRRPDEIHTPTPIAEDDDFPRPDRPAGWPEVQFGAWWIGVSMFMLLFSALWWSVAWPPPDGFAAFKLQAAFSIPIFLGFGVGALSVLMGAFGVLRHRESRPAGAGRLSTARRAARRTAVRPA